MSASRKFASQLAATDLGSRARFTIKGGAVIEDEIREIAHELSGVERVTWVRLKVLRADNDFTVAASGVSSRAGWFRVDTSAQIEVNP